MPPILLGPSTTVPSCRDEKKVASPEELARKNLDSNETCGLCLVKLSGL